MFALSNFIMAAANVLDMGLTLYYWIIIIRALISWVSADPYNPLVRFLYKATEPVLSRIRRILPWDFKFGIDISPIIAVFAIVFLKMFLVKTLIGIALRLQ